MLARGIVACRNMKQDPFCAGKRLGRHVDFDEAIFDRDHECALRGKGVGCGLGVRGRNSGQESRGCEQSK